MFVQQSNFGVTSAARCGFHTGQYFFHEHIHQFTEIVYILEGSIEISVEGAKETAKAGDIAVIAPFKTHSFNTPEYCKIWICVFSNDFVSDFVSADELYSGGDRFVFSPSKSLITYIDEHLIDSDENFLDLNIAIIRTLKASIHAVFEEYTRTVPHTAKKNRSNALSSVLLYMNENSRENITLKSVSAALGYSTGYISRCIKLIKNMNFCTLLNSFRVEYAKSMLMTTDFKVTEIAFESGFSNERSFHRAFLKTVGMTPGEYRKSKRTK